MTDPQQASYDELPYESKPWYPTHPESQATVATQFGLRPPPVESCRVLELGCGMTFVLAGAGKVAVSPGQTVAAGETLGTMGASKEQGNPVLYVELRREGRPVDPGGA